MVDSSIGGWRRRSRPDYNRPKKLRLSNRYTNSNGRRDLVARQPATRAPILRAIKELARTCKQALNLQDEIEGLKLNLIYRGFRRHVDGRLIWHARVQGSSKVDLATKQNLICLWRLWWYMRGQRMT